MDFYISSEPNNASYQAHEIQAGTHHILGTNDDWFKFKGAPGLIKLTMTPADDHDINMILYNSSMQIIGGQFAPGQEVIDYISSDSSQYFVKAFPTATTSSNYTLTLQTEENTGAWSKQLDFGPIRDVSVSLYDIDNDGKDEIFIGTSKALNSALQEIRPAGFIVLEDDGTVKWSVTFPAMAGSDPQTGQTYKTTSVSTAPAFADLDGDGHMEIIVGVGADSNSDAGPDVVGQPGDKGGVYALKSDGRILWFHQSMDIIGGASNTGEGRPDGVYGSPVVFDIDGDGDREVIVQGWDQSVTILNGRTGAVERRNHLADTLWATPRIADINGDNRFEILASADITKNDDAKTSTGGIFHVISSTGAQNIKGFDQPVGNPSYTELNGKWEEQALWSSPITGDIDGDGMLEIAYGTGNFFHDTRGSYIRVWEHDGTQKFKLETHGRTLATPLFADLNGDGQQEIIAATLEGYVHAWDRFGTPLFAVAPVNFGGGVGNPIFSSPVAVDLDGDKKLELIFTQGAQTMILGHDGSQITPSDRRENIVEFYKGSPAVRDIDRDGMIDIISGGATATHDQAVVYRWSNPFKVVTNTFTNARYQFHQSQTNIEDFVNRFYGIVLGRTADPAGRNDWTERLGTGISTGADVAKGFIFSQEFINRQTDDTAFLGILYQAFFNRAPDPAGYNDWTTQILNGAKREKVLDGFIHSQEFKNLCLTYSILPTR